MGCLYCAAVWALLYCCCEVMPLSEVDYAYGCREDIHSSCNIKRERNYHILQWLDTHSIIDPKNLILDRSHQAESITCLKYFLKMTTKPRKLTFVPMLTKLPGGFANTPLGPFLTTKWFNLSLQWRSVIIWCILLNFFIDLGHLNNFDVWNISKIEKLT